MTNQEEKVCPDCRQVCGGCLAAGLSATINEQAKLIGQLEAKVKRLKETSPNKELGDKIRLLEKQNADLQRENDKLKSQISKIYATVSAVERDAFPVTKS